MTAVECGQILGGRSPFHLGTKVSSTYGIRISYPVAYSTRSICSRLPSTKTTSVPVEAFDLRLHGDVSVLKMVQQLTVQERVRLNSL